MSKKPTQGAANDDGTNLDGMDANLDGANGLPDDIAGVLGGVDDHDDSGGGRVDVLPHDSDGGGDEEEEGDGAFDLADMRDTDEPAAETVAAEAAKVLNFANLDKAENSRLAELEEIRAELPDTRQTNNVVKRAEAMRKRNLIRFPETKDMIVMGAPKTVILDSDRNRWAAFEMLYGGFESPLRAFSDTFKGKLSDGLGREIGAKFPMGKLTDAISILGLQGQSADRLRKAFVEWALEHERNPLIERMERKLPEWDGVPRIAESMMTLFQCHDTALNREMGWYFWSSLYARIMHPGANAPVVLSLFGAQDAGKSFFTVRIVRAIMGDRNANPTTLDFGANEKDFLRTITGNSVIANIGEMVGFSRGDLNKIKAMVTRNADTFDFKFKDADKQPRQWIAVMDGNKYEGLQRDDTGNRRFYPLFVGQLPDVDGRPAWRMDGFKCPMIADGESKDFEVFMWNCLAEAREWVRANGGDERAEDDWQDHPDGIKAYEKRASLVSAMVKDFSQAEMNRDSGTVGDSMLEMFLHNAIVNCGKTSYKGRKENLHVEGTLLYAGDLSLSIMKASGSNRHPIPGHVDSKMTALGFKIGKFTAGKKGYIHHGYAKVMDFENPHDGFMAKLAKDSGTEEEVVTAAKQPEREARDEGF